eukprot:1195040-Prorocentrum_minimum.AAC.3
MADQIYRSYNYPHQVGPRDAFGAQTVSRLPRVLPRLYRSCIVVVLTPVDGSTGVVKSSNLSSIIGILECAENREKQRQQWHWKGRCA